jgi:hypothetical protein
MIRKPVPFPAFSLSPFWRRVSVCAAPRTRGSKEVLPPLFRPHTPRSFRLPLLLYHLIFGRATPLWRHHVTRSPGNRERLSQRRACRRQTREGPLPFPSRARAERAEEPTTVRSNRRTCFGCGVVSRPGNRERPIRRAHVHKPCDTLTPLGPSHRFSQNPRTCLNSLNR